MRHNSLKTLAELGQCSMDIIMRAETSQKRYSDKYVIIYTNGRTVQGQAGLLSTSKVDMLHRASQEAFSTHRILYLIENIITKSNPVSVCLSV